MVGKSYTHGAMLEDELGRQVHRIPRRPNALRRIDDEFRHRRRANSRESFQESLHGRREQIRSRLRVECCKGRLGDAALVESRDDHIGDSRGGEGVLEVGLGGGCAFDDGEVGVGGERGGVAGEGGDGVVSGKGFLEGDGAVAASCSDDENMHF